VQIRKLHRNGTAGTAVILRSWG